MVDNKIGNRKSQHSPRYIRVATAKGKPHTARRRRRVLIGNLWKIGIGIIPRVYKRSAFTIEIASCLLLIRIVRFGIGGLFAYLSRGNIVEGHLFPLTTGRTLAFHRRHDGVVDRSRWVVFEGDYMVKEGKGRKCLEIRRESLLSTNIINVNIKGCDGSTIG